MYISYIQAKTYSFKSASSC